MFGQALIRAFRLLVVVGANEAIEDLTDGQRQVIDIFVEDALHLIEQRERSLLGRPGSEAAHARAHTLHTAEQMHGLPCRRGGIEAARHRVDPRWEPVWLPLVG